VDRHSVLCWSTCAPAGATPDRRLEVLLSGVAVLEAYGAWDLRALAKVLRDKSQTRRLWALATIDGDVSFSAAAEIAGV
jgi:hypothetical protein